MRMTRRKLLSRTTAVALAIASGRSFGEKLLPSQSEIRAADKKPKVKPDQWEIGCFNRPWGAGTYDEALAGIQAAGFRLTGCWGTIEENRLLLPRRLPRTLTGLRSASCRGN